MRTTGNGSISVKRRLTTWMVSVATLESPSAAVTRSRTTCAPGVAKVVLATCWPAVNVPFPARLQAKAVSGLVWSVELDTSETGSPTTGTAGNHLNDATGGVGAAVT